MSAALSSFQSLLATDDLADLGPGPRSGVLSVGDLNTRLEYLFRAAPLPAHNRELIRALILLWHDHLDVAHTIAQEVEGADGAFVHGIMHRREPDFGNAAYWFRRVGNHPAFPEIAARVAALPDLGADSSLPSKLCPKGRWDPFGFVQLCEKASRSPVHPQQILLQKVQAIEASALLDHFSQAT